MESFNIIYIDDQIDLNVSEYLFKYTREDLDIKYMEIKFEQVDGYEKLLTDTRVREANLIFIDSQLFQNNNAIEGKYTGEQFKLILRKIFPYIEVVVITQNEIPPEYTTISKYDPRSSQSPREYYNSCMPSMIDNAVKNVCEYRKIVEELGKNNESKYLIEKIINSLRGSDVYDELKKTDIDNLVLAFTKIQESLDGGL